MCHFYSEIMIQIVKRKCCGSVFAACVEPDCYTDKDWLKNLKGYVNRGDKVEMIENGTLQFGGKCKCNEVAKIEQPDLFASVS
jgi:hypothetical protein